MKKLILCILLLLSIQTYSQNLKGKVVGIMDGDTFKILVDSTTHKIRLAHIDCPEKKQAFSAKATKFTSNAIFGKSVKVKILNKDRYGRYIGETFYNGSKNLSRELVKHGLAWEYIKYSKDKKLKTLQEKARKKKLGLWLDPNPIPPWEWRRKR